MTVLPLTLEQPLSAAMREGSQLEHQEAEDSSFMSELTGGRVNAEGYAAYLRRFRTVYEALESTARAHAGDPAVAAVADPALERLAAIDADLDHWAPGTPHETESPAATAYADRVRSATAEWGGLFLAHHYTRYLGDLSGGQVIGRVLDREFGLQGRGVAFYAFPAIAKPKPYKDGYRARLDALDLSPAEKARVVDEVKVAFRLNQAVFAELAHDLPAYRR